VVPGDYTWDGKLDLLVMSTPSRSSKTLELMLHIGSASTGFGASSGPTNSHLINLVAESSPVSIPPSTLSQPIPLDFNGDMRIDLLGHIASDDKNLYVWRNVWEKSNGTILYDTYVSRSTNNPVLTSSQD
jgi:integrin alpha FG-GAP repeat containing protein 1